MKYKVQKHTKTNMKLLVRIEDKDKLRIENYFLINIDNIQLKIKLSNTCLLILSTQ